jgi:transcriptional regulator with XRE-family HTH domain
MNLEAARLNRGLTVKEASERMGVARETLVKAERGIRPRADSAKRIADFYEVLVTDLWPVEPKAAA